MAADLTKALQIYIGICLLLYVGGVRVIGGDNFDIIDNFVEANETSTGHVIVNPDMVDSLPTTFEKSGSSQVLDFIDSLGTLGSMIAFVINLVFTPLALFTSAGMPGDIVILIGVPIMIGLFLGIAYFIRSGS